MKLVLVDSSAWTQSLRKAGDEAVRARVQDLLATESAAWCDMVRLELWNGVRGESERIKLRQLELKLPNLPITSEVWDRACALASRARIAGVTVPSADVLIMACATVHGARLEHVDRHYEMLANL